MMPSEKLYQQKLGDVPKAKEPDMSACYTAGDYLNWTFEGLYEIIKGKVWKMAPAPDSEHAKIDINLLRQFLQAFPKGSCHVFTAPFDVYLLQQGESVSKGTTVVQPDICVVCDPAKIEKKGCVGAPDLVVEILSPSTAKKDMNDKFNVYEEYGVQEYWVVFPGENAINVYSLVEGSFEQHKIFSHDDELQSPLFAQLHFSVSQIFSQKTPSAD